MTLTQVSEQEIIENAKHAGLVISGLPDHRNAYFLRLQNTIFLARGNGKVRTFRAPSAALRAIGQLPSPTPNCLRAGANHLHFCLNCDNIIEVIPRAQNECESDSDHDFALCDTCIMQGFKTS